MIVAEKVYTEFTQMFGAPEFVVSSPGRINLIGEHTDYNNGFVLPAAIDKVICVAVSKRTDEKIFLYASQYKESFETTLHDIKPTQLHWPNYILGVTDELIKSGNKISGFNMVIDGDVPLGAGMSSSAALECAVAKALDVLFNIQLTNIDIVKTAQLSEHHFAGLQCGIMDMFASVFGKKNHAIQLDCRSLEYRYVPLDLKNVQIVLFDTNVKHQLASTEYNTRRKECEAGVEIIKTKYPHVESLRDADSEMLELLKHEPVIYSRCKFVVEEKERLLAACEDLEKNDIKAFGKKMYETHEGLSKLYEVSCKELDFLVDQVKEDKNVYGSRMMGGGFGGCTINLIDATAVNDITETVAEKYNKATGLVMNSYIVAAGDGTKVLKM